MWVESLVSSIDRRTLRGVYGPTNAPKTLVLSHAMLSTYTPTSYAQSTCQLAVSATLTRHGIYNNDIVHCFDLQCLHLRFEPLVSINSTFGESIEQHI